MMKKSRLTRLFSLFTAMLMVVSMLSAVASASEIQPRVPTCACGNPIEAGTEHDPRERIANTSYTCQGVHYKTDYFRVERCSGCGDVSSKTYLRSEYECECGGSCGIICRCF